MRIDVGALGNQGFHQVQIACLFLIDIWLGIPGFWSPLDVDHRVKRSDSSDAGKIGVRAAIKQELGNIKMPVDDGHDDGSHFVAVTDGIDVRAAFDQRFHGGHVAFTGGEEQGCHAALEIGSDLARGTGGGVTGAGFQGREADICFLESESFC